MQHNPSECCQFIHCTVLYDLPRKQDLSCSPYSIPNGLCILLTLFNLCDSEPEQQYSTSSKGIMDTVHLLISSLTTHLLMSVHCRV